MQVRHSHVPIIPGFYPDPTICRTPAGFFLATSSFEYAPGVPIFHSDDLLTWTQIGNALERPSQFAAGSFPASHGVFAPTLRHHDDRFWLITTAVRPGVSKASILVTAEDPVGPWSDPIVIPIDGIDPDITWDEHGACYVTWCATGTGAVHIEQVQIDPTSGDLLETPRRLWSGTGLAHPEAPHLYRRGNYWYLLVSEGGTERGHAVSIARGSSVTGPFTGAPSNPILTHRSTTHPVQNTGHADLVELADGSWAVVFLGVRPRGASPGFHVNGRETFLGGLSWVEDWPVIDVERFHGSAPATEFDERFDQHLLHPRWVSPGVWPTDAAPPNPGGGRILRQVVAQNGAPSGIAVRVSDEYWEARASLEPGPSGAVEVFIRLDDAHLVTMRLQRQVVSVEARVGPLHVLIGAPSRLPAGSIELRIRALPSRHHGPDDLEFAASTSGQTHVFGRIDGRYLATEVAGGFTGRVLGVASAGGEHVVRRIVYRPLTTYDGMEAEQADPEEAGSTHQFRPVTHGVASPAMSG